MSLVTCFVLSVLIGSVVTVVDDTLVGRFPNFGVGALRPGANALSCEGSSGFTGTCMTRFNCLRSGGRVSGFCATYGICCETNLQCGKTSALKRTLIQNPSNIPSSCIYTFSRYSASVCQLKIDLEQLTLEQPDTSDGTRCVDRFQVNGVTLCGNNDGQHLYIPFEASTTGATISMTFTLPNQDSSSKWRIVVTQLECAQSTPRTVFKPFTWNGGAQNVKNIFTPKTTDLGLLAPPGCLQYYTARSGRFQSFNYNSGRGPYMAGLDYAVCFHRLPGDSAIKFVFGTSELPKASATAGQVGYDASCHSTIPTDGRSEDYLMIPGAITEPLSSPGLVTNPTYFCGSLAGEMVTSSTPGPFVIYFHSDQIYTTEDKGFQVNYAIS